MTCKDGVSTLLTVPASQFRHASGAYTEMPGGIGVAVSRGDKSDAALLRAKFRVSDN